jgi:hypothetical protein
MLIDATASRKKVLFDTLSQLASLRQQAEAVPNQPNIDGVIEAIKFYQTELPRTRNRLQTLEWCGRAIADLRHEVAAVRYGWESDEADAVFEAGERELNELLFSLRQASAA